MKNESNRTLGLQKSASLGTFMYVNDNYDYLKVNQKETLIKIEFYAVIVT